MPTSLGLPVIHKESERDPEFGRWIGEIAENIRQCIHCGQCSGSCPLSGYMDRSPRKLMHLAREGFKDLVLGSFSIWLCTSCYACRVKCPRGIKVTDVMYALKRRAIREGLYSRRFPIPALAKEFKSMVYRNGRVSESELVVRLKLKTNPLSMMGMAPLGINLLKTGRMSMKREKIRNREQLRKLLDATEPMRVAVTLHKEGSA
jgi:quinone-modifying oxidoreductase, subunit QmoC